jgi:Tfp pilus assembly protein PilF
MSERHIAPNRFACALLLVALLAGCTSAGLTGSIADNEEPVSATSSANIASLSDVVQRNPSDPQAYNTRGSVLGQAARNDEALADFNKAISLDPNYAQAYANRALVYRQTNKLDLALADYNKALSIDPNYTQAYLGRGIVYRSPSALIMRRPITIAACSIKASVNTSSQLTISPLQSGCRRSRRSRWSHAP